MSWDEVMCGVDWKNLTLLMTDKLRYAGKDKGRKRPEKIATKEQEYDFFKSIMT